MSQDPDLIFERHERLGRGSFGEVFKGIDTRTQKVVAIKIIDLEEAEDDIEDIQQEIRLLSECDSQHIVKYFGSYVKGTQLWIVMEFLGGGSASDLLKAGVMQEQHIATFIRATLSGLLYLHSNNKIHRDIKSSNILVGADGNVKLADFGVSARIGDTMSKRNTFVGTPYWMAPEVIRQSGYNCSADIWSLGITAMELAEGHPPRSNIHPMKVLFQIPRDPPPELDETKCKYSRDFKDFINQCLKKDPEERPSAKDLLRHRFIKNAARTNILIELVERFHFYEANNQNSDEEDNVSQDSHHDRGNDATVTSWSYDTVQATIKQRPTIEPVVDDEAEFEWDDATIKKGSMVVNHDKRSPLMGVQVARDMMAMESVDSLQMLQPILSKMIAKESDAAIRLTLAELMHGFEKLDRQSPRALGEIVDTIRRPPQPSTPTTQTTKDAHGSNSVSQFLLSRWRKTSATPYGDE